MAMGAADVDVGFEASTGGGAGAGESTLGTAVRAGVGILLSTLTPSLASILTLLLLSL